MSGANSAQNKTEETPPQRIVSIRFCPSIYRSKNEREEKEESNEKSDLITTPPFFPAERPQSRLITDKVENIDEIIKLHQRLEVLECKIRQNPEYYQCSTDSVADLYSSISEFEIDPEDTNFFATYSIPPDSIKVPNFWEKRVYDRDEEKMDDEKSEKLKARIEKRMDILLVDKPERTDWRERRKLMKIIEKEEPGQTERRSRISRWVEPAPPLIQRRKRRVEVPQVRIHWYKGIFPTDDSEDDTDPFDFSFDHR